MSKLNADGTPRKKYVSKKMKLARNRKNGQKKHGRHGELCILRLMATSLQWFRR